jgi:hypothetical protein
VSCLVVLLCLVVSCLVLSCFVLSCLILSLVVLFSCRCRFSFPTQFFPSHVFLLRTRQGKKSKNKRPLSLNPNPNPNPNPSPTREACLILLWVLLSCLVLCFLVLSGLFFCDAFYCLVLSRSPSWSWSWCILCCIADSSLVSAPLFLSCFLFIKSPPLPRLSRLLKIRPNSPLLFFHIDFLPIFLARSVDISAPDSIPSTSLYMVLYNDELIL